MKKPRKKMKTKATATTKKKTKTKPMETEWKSSRHGTSLAETVPVGATVAVDSFDGNRFTEARVVKHLPVRTLLHVTDDDGEEGTYDLTIRRFFVLSGLTSQNDSVTIENSSSASSSSSLSSPAATAAATSKTVDASVSILPKLYDRVSCRWGDGNFYEGTVKNVLMNTTQGPVVFIQYDVCYTEECRQYVDG
mmetsp:Transcript_17111/g.41507  ORF Transcript_17111/g.41507 Transcript_17111/m.41507 type:complete len:193 (+) Transcript_17111:221-799(+)